MPGMLTSYRLTRRGGVGRVNDQMLTAVAMVATITAGTATRRRQSARIAVPPRASDAPVPAVVNPRSASAAENSAALAKRSAGTFSSARASAATTLGGTFRRSSFTGRATSVMIRMITCCAAPPTCGGCPASIS